MTKEDLINSNIWSTGKSKMYSNFFKKEVEIRLENSDDEPISIKISTSEKSIQTIMDFLNLSESHKPLMQKLLYKHCVDCCEQISYGFEVKEGEDETDVNMREFGATNEQSALENAKLYNVTIEVGTNLRNRYAIITFYPEWEIEHGCVLILKNGELLDYCGEAGVWLDKFE